MADIYTPCPTLKPNNSIAMNRNANR